VAVAGIMAMAFQNKFAITEDIIKHTIFNSIRARNMQFKGEFGKMYIICDSHEPPCWRYEIFPEYKARRKIKKKADEKIDWNFVFKVMSETKQILIDNFPFPVVTVDRCEGDDVIGHSAALCSRSKTKCMIVGGDKDYYQCHDDYVVQYLINKKIVFRHPDPKAALTELIVRGDGGDDIPNIKSQNDIFLTEGVKQGSITKEFLAHFIDGGDPEVITIKEKKKRNKATDEMEVIPAYDIDVPTYYKRNQQLIDFDYIPDDLKKDIEVAMLSATKQVTQGNRNRVFKYLAKAKMRMLLQKFNDFF